MSSDHTCGRATCFSAWRLFGELRLSAAASQTDGASFVATFDVVLAPRPEECARAYARPLQFIATFDVRPHARERRASLYARPSSIRRHVEGGVPGKAPAGILAFVHFRFTPTFEAQVSELSGTCHAERYMALPRVV